MNAAIYAARGDCMNAALSAAAMIPIAGWAATGAKVTIKAVDAAKGVAHYSDDLVIVAQKLYPNKAGKIELHHPVPQYLGGVKSQKLVPLDAAYHQQITNEFRRLHPYGSPKPSPQRLQEIMNEVYSKFPLPQ